jgi:hypothetical protein
VHVDQIGTCSYQVTAWVDAQNGFGAVLRMPYSMTLTYDLQRQEWRASGIKISD